MRKFKIALFICLPFLLDVLVACCNCGKGIRSNFSNTKASVFNLDYSNGNPALQSSGQISKTAYGIRFDQTREILACNDTRIPMFTASAYAFKCKCDPAIIYIPKDTIIDLKIFTVNGFDSLHPFNSDITQFFKVFDGVNNPRIDIGTYIKTNSPLYSELTTPNFVMDLYLTKSPLQSAKHQFKIIIQYSDGRKQELKTELVDLI